MQDTTTIDITGIDKVALLKELHKMQKIAGFFFAVTGPPFDNELAASAVTGYIDYFCGRAIKADISQNSVDTRLYDRDAGKGAFARAVAKLAQ